MTTSRSDRETRRIIRIVAALVLDSGKTLLVRKRDTRAFMQPGGKIHEAETPLQTLQRELQEELGCGILSGSERLLGQYQGPAANEPEALLHADLYAIGLSGDPMPLAEIEDMIWIDVHRPTNVELAPFTKQFALPWARTLSSEARIG